jgi:hypothetical protein
MGAFMGKLGDIYKIRYNENGSEIIAKYVDMESKPRIFKGADNTHYFITDTGQKVAVKDDDVRAGKITIFDLVPRHGGYRRRATRKHHGRKRRATRARRSHH